MAKEQNADALRIAAHTLKGSSANMCTHSISSLCEKIEAKAKDSNFTEIALLIEQLKEIHPKVLSILKAF